MTAETTTAFSTFFMSKAKIFVKAVVLGYSPHFWMIPNMTVIPARLENTPSRMKGVWYSTRNTAAADKPSMGKTSVT